MTSLPFTKGDVRQFLVGAVLAIGTALVPNIGALTHAHVRDVDWSTFGWNMADNLMQSAAIYVTAWWTLTRSGIVRQQQVTPASEVRPRSEPVVEQVAHDQQ